MGMRLSFKPNVTCRPTRNLWFVNCERILNVQMSKQRGKKLAVGRRPLVPGGSSHGATCTMVNPALP